MAGESSDFPGSPRTCRPRSEVRLEHLCFPPLPFFSSNMAPSLTGDFVLTTPANPDVRFNPGGQSLSLGKPD